MHKQRQNTIEAAHAEHTKLAQESHTTKASLDEHEELALHKSDGFRTDSKCK